MLKTIVEPAGDQRLEGNVMHKRQRDSNFPSRAVPKTCADLPIE
jgi:hypothetical protein